MIVDELIEAATEALGRAIDAKIARNLQPWWDAMLEDLVVGFLESKAKMERERELVLQRAENGNWL